MYNILVCDDDKDIVEAIDIYLSKEGYNVIKAYDGMEAMEILKKEDIQLLLIDVMMPRLDGIRATLKIREKSIIPIIILSAKSEDSDKIIGLDVGADDYIAKPFSLKVLLKRVERQLYLEQKRNSEVYELIYKDIKLNTLSYTVYDKGIEANLTPTEFKVLRLLMLTPGEVLTIEELSKKISIDGEYVPPRIIGNYISNIRSKLAYSGSIIHNIRGVGYKIE